MFLDLPCFLLPWGFHVRACLVVLEGLSQGVANSSPASLEYCFVYWLLQSSWLLMVSGQCMRKICRRQLLMYFWIFLAIVTLILQVSAPYSRTDLMLELKRQILILMDMFPDF